MTGTAEPTAAPVRLEVDEHGVATVSLHRPDKLNIYNLAMRDALIESFLAVRDHPDARVLLLRAEGKHFSAGADLSEFGTAPSIFEARRIRRDCDPWMPLWELPQPTVVALHGYALGAGLEMALLCDIRVAARDTKVGLPETRLGILPAAGGTQSLARAVGTSRALPLVLTAETVDAERALALGLVSQVVDDVEGEALAIARRIAALPAGVAVAARRGVKEGLDVSLESALALERRLARAIRASRAGGTPDRAAR